MARHTSRSRLRWILVAVVLAVVASASVAWAGSSDEGDIARNVYVDGSPVGGLTEAAARQTLADQAAEVAATPIEIEIDGSVISITAAEVGVYYDVEATLAEVLAARHGGGFFPDPVDWFSSWWNVFDVEPVITVDTVEARRSLDTPSLVVLRPVEPRLELGSDLVAVPGSDGAAGSLDDLVAGLLHHDFTTGALRLTPSILPIAPTLEVTELEEVAAEINRLTERGLSVTALGNTRHFPPEELRSLFVVTQTQDGAEVQLNTESLAAKVELAFGRIWGNLEKPELDVLDGEVIVVKRGRVPDVCCASDALALVEEAIMRGWRGPLNLPTVEADDPDLVAWADGSTVVEPVGEFTTHHACCEGRVTNIQLFADLVKGLVILPGESVSMNEYVGPRTREKGFVAAGAIRGGHLIPEIGGGVSQFATTLFNAAYLAGLDFDEYRSHTVYFSRYPFGREATISDPAPDLILNNTTDHPVLIWPSYTGTSITVTMYSTQHVTVEETGQRTSRRAQCTHVETTRQRTYPDGRVVEDTVVADYRPGEGIDCNGNRIPPPIVP